MLIDHYIHKFQNLNTGKVGSHVRPHKPVMLMSVLTLLGNGCLGENRIEFTPELIEIFKKYFEIVRTDTDDCTPINPFFFLRSDGFWHHKRHPGQEEVYKVLNAPGGTRILNQIIAYSYLDDDLFRLLTQQVHRLALLDSLISRYFPEDREKIQAVYIKEGEVGDYRRQIEGKESVLEVRETPKEIRDTAFRRLVVSSYDFRCAACGIRVIIEDQSMVEAAHLIPYAISKDDDPRNGIALCHNHHWAMDRFLIAPGLDFVWHVSELLDRRIRDHQPVYDLESQKILMPRQAKFHPKNEGLNWRMGRLLKSGPD